MNPLLVSLLIAALISAGFWLLVTGVTGPITTGRTAHGRGRATPALVRRAVVAVLAAVLGWWLTGWPVALVLAGAGGWFLPALLRPDRARKVEQRRIEAIATWTEMLRDTLASAAGLEQAVLATADIAPAPLRPALARLRERVEAGHRLPAALTGLAEEINDPLADLVILALVQAAERQARDLGRLLGDLAITARDQAALRLRIAAGRARIITSVRIIVGITTAMALGLVLLSHSYLAPYTGATGQVVLLIVGGIFGLAYAWLARTAQAESAPRLLAPTGAGDPAPREVVS